jgi:hypothetical protein
VSRGAFLCGLCAPLLWLASAHAASPAEGETREEAVDFDAEEAAPAAAPAAKASEESEVDFEAEEKAGAKADSASPTPPVAPAASLRAPMTPEYDTQPWLVLLPAVWLGFLILNISWRPKGGRLVTPISDSSTAAKESEVDA